MAIGCLKKKSSLYYYVKLISCIFNSCNCVFWIEMTHDSSSVMETSRLWKEKLHALNRLRGITQGLKQQILVGYNQVIHDRWDYYTTKVHSKVFYYSYTTAICRWTSWRRVNNNINKTTICTLQRKDILVSLTLKTPSINAI